MTPVLALSASISDFGFTILDCGEIITDGNDNGRFALHETGEVGSVSTGICPHFYHLDIG